MSHSNIENSPKLAWNKFYFFCISQFISLVGSGLTGFTLTVLLFKQTELVSYLSIAALCDKLPGVFLGVFAGVFVDRYCKKKIIIAMDLLAAVNTVWLAIIFWLGVMELWHILIFMTIGATIRTIHVIAFNAIIPTLIKKKDLVKANGLVQTIISASGILAPFLAGVLLGFMETESILLIDLGSFLIATTIILLLGISSFTGSKISKKDRLGVLEQSKDGVKYISENPSLKTLLIFISSINFIVGFLHVIITPMVLSFTDEKNLGFILSCGAAGMLFGSITVTMKGVGEKYGRSLCLIASIEGVFLIMLGFIPNILTMGASMFFLFFCFPFFAACNQAIWQRKVPLELQGRIMALKQVCIWSGLSLAYIISGPLIDYFFTPLIQTELYRNSVGLFFGNTIDRGMGLLLILMGLLIMGISYWSCKKYEFINIEKILKDKI